MVTLGLVVLGLVIFYLGFVFGWAGRRFMRHRSPFDGVINVTETEDKLVYSLELNKDAGRLKEMKEVIFEVKVLPTIGDNSH